MLFRLLRRSAVAASVVAGGTSILVIYNVGQSTWADSHTWSSATKHYITNKFMACLGYVAFRQLVKDSRNVREVQEKFLMQNLEKNKSSIYGKEHGLDRILSVDDFRMMHPLTRYPHYRKYVDRIMEGDLLAMTGDPPLQLAVTSGTSGSSSLLPTTSAIFTRFFLSGVAILFQRLHQVHPEWVTLQRSMKLFYTPRWKFTQSGLRIGPNSSNPDSAKSIHHLYSTPPPAYRILSEPEALYVHLLFGLLDSKLGIIESNFASTVYTGFKTLEKSWPQLVQDIRTGKLSPSLDIDPEVRADLESRLAPQEERADQLEKEFKLGFTGIAKRIWPQLNVVLCTTSGPMSLYHDALKASYCAGVSSYSPIYGASEGLLGVNLSPGSGEEPTYCLVPSAQFFEFLPSNAPGDSEDSNPPTLLLHQLKKGESYEVVITNPSGLYRYRLGDVVQVVGFLNELPVVRFGHRVGQLLNVHGEKISEEVLYKALTDTCTELGTSIRDYTTVESVLVGDVSDWCEESATPHYLVFVEWESGGVPEEDAAALHLDSCLRRLHPVYESFRAKGSIAQLKVIQTKSGCFEALRNWRLTNSDTSGNQYKVPRVLKTKQLVQFLLEQKIN